MRIGRAMLVLLGVASGLVLLSRMAVADKPAPVKTPWRIVGQLEEACSCAKACPCWFDSKPTRMTCGGGQFLFIQKGNYGGVPLEGLAVGNMAQSPEGKGMMESFGSWNFSYLYIDEKANPEQRKALEAIGGTVLPLHASTKTELRVVPIGRTVEGKEHKITLGQYGSFSGHLVEGGMGGAVKIVNPPGADPLHQEYQQGETTKLAYTDADQKWSFEGSNYMYGTFELDNVMYEKYAAGLAQKMEERKKQDPK
ncbi:MAG: hypothetical protein DMH00_00055 [Acidobacteria bacterium]|nr:MAG: hypothetical protein DMH00_00055 [Acidobacteriota bacterium]